MDMCVYMDFFTFFNSSSSDAKVYDVHIASGAVESVTAFHRSIIPSLEFTLTTGKVCTYVYVTTPTDSTHSSSAFIHTYCASVSYSSFSLTPHLLSSHLAPPLLLSVSFLLLSPSPPSTSLPSSLSHSLTVIIVSLTVPSHSAILATID